MNITPISACSMAQCTYNQGNQCHTPGITVGPHAECSTYTYANPEKSGLRDIRAGIGACLAAECRYNEKLECAAPGIDVQSHTMHADCRTFQLKK